MHDLRADGTEQDALDGVQAAAADHNQVGVLRRLDDNRAGVTLALDRFGVDPPFGEEPFRLLQVALALLDLRGVEMRPFAMPVLACDSAAATTRSRSASAAKSATRCRARFAESDPS
jgi:hypothetical protein